MPKISNKTLETNNLHFRTTPSLHFWHSFFCKIEYHSIYKNPNGP